MTVGREQYAEAAAAALLGMNTADPDPQIIVDAAHSFGFVFKSLQSVIDSLKTAGLDNEAVVEYMNAALGKVMNNTNAAEEYDYLLEINICKQVREID